ncbi:helix-turn-helix domain-containing protein [Tersicoccus sp. MR15.9]|uniref:TetR/AcrR family transcriptional regulator n=1 Tax=Tersicoccus mangrovi TaxID=3121635 RepID=UPI002FE5ABA3
MTRTEGASEGDSERPSIWDRPVRGARGPAAAHGRDDIAAAAMDLADAEGLAAVSMRAVAAALGTGAGSLYRYVAARDDLLDLMTDRAVGHLLTVPAPSEDGVEGMLVLAQQQRDLIRRHRWLVDALASPIRPGPNALAWFDRCLAVLEATDTPVAARFEAIALMTGLSSTMVRGEAGPASFSFGAVDRGTLPHLGRALAGAASPAPPSATPPPGLFDRAVRGLLRGLLETDADTAP